jgi:hypothetical protein
MTPADVNLEAGALRVGRLPSAVFDLAQRLGASPGSTATKVRLKQTGLMRQDDASAWMRFRAAQTISTDHCSFEWRARTGPLNAIEVRDALLDDQGRISVRALGFVPIGGMAPSAALTRGELMRYLAELAWAPQAILLNPDLRWKVERPDQIVVSAGDAAAEVLLSLDGLGRIAGALAHERPRAVGGALIPTPWQGRFSDYRQHEGFWLPFAGQVAWVIDGVEQIYWKGRLEAWATWPAPPTAGVTVKLTRGEYP